MPFAITVVVLVNSGEVAAGRTMVAMICIAHAILGMLLIISERRLWISGIGQSLFPVVILLLMIAA